MIKYINSTPLVTVDPPWCSWPDLASFLFGGFRYVCVNSQVGNSLKRATFLGRLPYLCIKRHLQSVYLSVSLFPTI